MERSPVPTGALSTGALSTPALTLNQAQLTARSARAPAGRPGCRVGDADPALTLTLTQRTAGSARACRSARLQKLATLTRRVSPPSYSKLPLAWRAKWPPLLHTTRTCAACAHARCGPRAEDAGRTPDMVDAPAGGARRALACPGGRRRGGHRRGCAGRAEGGRGQRSTPTGKRPQCSPQGARCLPPRMPTAQPVGAHRRAPLRRSATGAARPRGAHWSPRAPGRGGWGV